MIRCFISLLVAISFYGFTIPSAPQGLVYDQADMVSPVVEQAIEEDLRRFERETSNQIVVATFPSLEGEVLEDVTIRIAEAWRPGQKGRDNGVILFVFRDDRAIRIEVGYGLEGALPDATAHAIIQNDIVPLFRQETYEGGIMSGVAAIARAIQGEYVIAPQVTVAEIPLPILIVVAVVALLLLVFAARYMPWIFIPLFILGMGLGAGGHRGRGGGGGFGGFGGGSFGGGGASGRW